MMPSSRTPEGEPVRCSTCGTDSRVDVSRPPGDAVCPACGAIFWSGFDHQGIQRTKIVISRFVAGLRTRVADQDFSDDACRYLVAGLKNSLAAHGAILWSARPGRLPGSAHIPILKCHVGQVDSPAFAAEVMLTRHEIQRYDDVDGKRCLLLGVPLINSGRVSGAIEIVQRDVDSETVRGGYRKFLLLIADMAAPLAT